VIVTIAKVALGLDATNAHPDTQTADLDLLLCNHEHHVKAVQVDVCADEDWRCKNVHNTNQDTCEDTDCKNVVNEENCYPPCSWDDLRGCRSMTDECMWVDGQCIAKDNMVCTACIIDEDRTPEYICSAHEITDPEDPGYGCCKVVLFSTNPDDLIQERDGAVALIKYDIFGDLTSKDCIPLWPSRIKVADQYNEALCAVPKQGEICFYVCGDVYPQDCYECASCGDGTVDIFDMLEAIDIVLGIQTATPCQVLHGDVPLGIPPYCGDPPGVNPPNCGTDGVIDIFDALVIIDKALSKMNCCDDCMYGEIY